MVSRLTKTLKTKLMVPKKGLEPPHPCEYMDLNHARLPIPPLRHYVAPDKTRRCDGKYSSILKGLLNVSNPQQPRHPALRPGVPHFGSDPRGVTIRIPLANVDQW